MMAAGPGTLFPAPGPVKHGPFVVPGADQVVDYQGQEIAPAAPGSTPALGPILAAGTDALGLPITDLLDPVNPQDAATKNYVDTTIGPTPGLSAVTAVNNSAGTRKITDVVDPAAAQDAATKGYVDGLTITRHIGVVDPVVGNDNTQGYAIGSRWINTATSSEFVAISVSTGAAVWVQTTLGSALTRIEYTLGADVAVNAAAGTYVDGPNGTPPAGTYDVSALLTVSADAGLTQPFAGRLIAGAAIIDERDGALVSAAGAGNPTVIALTARVVLDGITVIKAAATKGVANGTMNRDSVWGTGISHRATIMVLTLVSH